MVRGRPRIFILLAFLILAGMIIPPVSAYYSQMDIEGRYSDDPASIIKSEFDQVTIINFNSSAATNDTLIYGINMKLPINAIVNFTIYYGDGQSLEGFTHYTWVYPGASIRGVSLNGITVNQPFVDIYQYGRDTEIISYASNLTDDGTLISEGIMIHNPAFVGQNILSYYPVSSFEEDLITGIDITSTKPIDVVILASTSEIILKNAGATNVSFLGIAQDFINYAMSIAAFVLAMVIGLFAWLKFFFVDNLLMTVSLYLAITMAYSACTSRNIFQFFRKFFNDQRKLFEFIIGLWRVLIEIISSFRAIFRI